MYDERNLDQEPVTKIQFWAKRHLLDNVTLSEFQPLRLFPHRKIEKREQIISIPRFVKRVL